MDPPLFEQGRIHVFSFTSALEPAVVVVVAEVEAEVEASPAAVGSPLP